MQEAIFSRFNQFRKQKFLTEHSLRPSKKYAFVGVGMHSLQNLYPLLRHFGVTLKYICTSQSDWSQTKLKTDFPGCQFIHSIEILAVDSEIEGVFISAAPASHYSILVRLLAAKKKIFVEKPPCTSIVELNDLIEKSESLTCKVGLQRKYWPGNRIALKKLQKAKSYFYQFHFGAYPNGNCFYELFIHALEFAKDLMGSFEIKSFTNSKDSTGITCQAHVTHGNNCSGLLELSTQFAWNNPKDRLEVNCENESLIIEYPMLILGIQKPKRIFNLPTERLLQNSIVYKEYFSAGRLIVPAFESNSFVIQGFYDEIKTFIEIVETGNAQHPINDLVQLLPTYKIVDILSKG